MFGEPPVSKYVEVAGREIHYLEWGREDASPVVCAHALARVGRDFDALARELAPRWRVVAFDQIGRGTSQWSADPDADYNFATYAEIAVGVCDALGIVETAWIGTSMGGTLGMKLAAGAMRGRITRLVVNDIGTALLAPAIDRIVGYVGKPPTFDTFSRLEHYLMGVYSKFGYIPGEEWRGMAEASFRRLPDGKVTVHYDPAIVRQLENRPGDFDAADAWGGIDCPVLLLRGEHSDILPADMAAAMLASRPATRFLDCRGCGHAPALNVPVQTETVAGFLTS